MRIIVLAGLIALVGCVGDEVEIESQPPKPHLAFGMQPTDAIAGTALAEVRVTLMDASGAVLHTPGEVTLRLASGPEGVTLPAVEAPMLHGNASFQGITLTSAGRYVFEARMDSLQALSQTFTISAGAPGRLVVAAEPIEEAVAGEPLAPSIKVAVQDAYGNALPRAGGEVTASLMGDGGTLSGSLTAPVVEGVATFSNLVVDKAGIYRLAFRYGLETAVASRLVRIIPGTAAALGFWAQPSTTVAGETITPAVAVAVLDRSGNLVTHASTAITLALGANPGGGVLNGTLTVAAVQGVATFADLSLPTSAEGYTLQATAGTLTPAQSEPFAIVPAGP